MVIEKKNVSELLPAEYNPRKDLKPGDAEYEKLKRSIEQFGYVEPVIWNKTTGKVVGGHQRLKVLMDMGITEVECVVVEMSVEKEKALNIALNKISGEWDKDKLALLITDLQGADFDVSLTGSMLRRNSKSLPSPNPVMYGLSADTHLFAGTAPKKRPLLCLWATAKPTLLLLTRPTM